MLFIVVCSLVLKITYQLNKGIIRMNLKLVAMALSVGLLSGCSSLVSDSKYPVAIASTPNQASFILKNKDGVIVQS